jgi:hypothetical protein
MLRSLQKMPFNRLLCADTRFSLPDVLNDHCWEVDFTIALSLFTTYGLRASRMLVFPSFTLDDQTVQDPAQFFTRPVVTFSSVNFITLTFSPFQGIDVVYNIWVPSSQIISGEIVYTNQTQSTKSLLADWQVQLSPLMGGNPMKHAQMGMSTVLQGECGDLFPVFYLSGELSPSRSAIPGLTTRYMLMPAVTKYSTWVLASLSTSDASFQLARQYSAKSLDVEKLRIEMADRHDQMHITSVQTQTSEIIQLSRVRAQQLLMPPMANFKSPTFVSDRGPDTGHYQRQDLLEINPEWCGETLPQIWMMSQSLLPGSPELVRGFITNMLSRRPTSGGIDHRVGVNGTLTGHAALPLMAQLTVDLHPFLNDLPWLEEIYPDLLALLKTWLMEQSDGSLHVKGLSHPIQLAAQFSGDDALAASDIWMKLKSDNNLLILSLLIREVTDLIQISRWLTRSSELEWLEKLKERLVTLLFSYRDRNTGLFRHPENTPDHPATGTVLHAYKHSGLYTPRRRLPTTGKLFLRITGDAQHLPADFFCTVTTSNASRAATLQVRPADLTVIGQTRVFVTDQVFDFIDTVEIRNLPRGLSLEVGQPSYEQPDLLQMLVLYTGVLTTNQADQLLRHLPVRDYFTGDGVSLLPTQPGEPVLLAPAYLLGLIVEGLLRYEKIHLADQVFKQHFINKYFIKDDIPIAALNAANLILDDLVPVRLFLKLNGVSRITDREVILSHFIKRKQDAVTVQYNKLELRLKPYLTEIHTQSGDVIYLNRAGPNRVILD